MNAKINYFENNKHRMKYGTYRKKGYFYGSGVIEAGCKSVIGKRAIRNVLVFAGRGKRLSHPYRTAQ
ncbi:MAG: hypothetical protein O3C20_05300 [Verrucomicrobia bacterium]|nr:hypothetical protein [Verrucomicrobiota bacterium]